MKRLSKRHRRRKRQQRLAHQLGLDRQAPRVYAEDELTEMTKPLIGQILTEREIHHTTKDSKASLIYKLLQGQETA